MVKVVAGTANKTHNKNFLFLEKVASFSVQHTVTVP